jgi:hypothetical protein
LSAVGLRPLALALVGLALGSAACGSSEDAVTGDRGPAAERLKEGEGESVLEGEARTCDPPAAIATSEVVDLLPERVTLPTGTVIVG